MAEISLLDAFEESSKLSAQKAANLINAKKGVNDGFAALDENGKIPSDQLPKNMEIDGSLTIHGLNSEGERTGYKANIINDASGVNDIHLPSKSGTIAVTSDIPTKTSQLTNDSKYVQLDANGKVPASQLPASLDEVIEVEITWNEDGSFKQAKRVKDNVIITASDMIEDVLYVNVAEDKYANNLYRWSGSTLILCPYNPKTEDITVEFEYPNAGHITSENIESGETLSQIFAKIHALIDDNNYSHSQFKNATDNIFSHTQDKTIHIKGIDTTPTMNSENVVTSHAIYVMGSEFNSRLAPIEYYIENPTELPFMEESEFISAINTALSEVEI